MSELTKRQKIFIQEAINTQALEFGNFILKSGRESPYFFNASKLIAKGNLSLITDAFEEIFNNASIKIDQIFGPAYKGTILGSFLGLRLQKNNNEISLCFNRKEIKDHGEKGVFIGAKPTGRVLIIDDVLSELMIQVDKAIKAAPKAKDPKAKPSDASPKVENADWNEDLDLIVAEEATLSDGFREKAGAIFEAAYKLKVGAKIDELESEYAQNLEAEVADIQSGLVEKVDSYLNYVVENWMKENEVAVEQGLRTEIAEEFMNSLQTVFKEHYIEVPEGKADLIDDLADQVSELEEQLNKSTEDNIQLHEKAQSYERASIVAEQSSGLADTEAEKLASLVEDIDFEDKETFEMKVKTVKESYFKQEVSESTDESDALVGNESTPVEVSDAMSAYTNAITKHNS